MSLPRAGTPIWKAQRKTGASMCKIYDGVCKDSEVTRVEAEVAGTLKDARNIFYITHLLFP